MEDFVAKVLYKGEEASPPLMPVILYFVVNSSAP